jgi:hypothetical protein
MDFEIFYEIQVNSPLDTPEVAEANLLGQSSGSDADTRSVCSLHSG